MKKRTLSVIIGVILVLCSLVYFTPDTSVRAASAVKLNKKKKTMYVGDTYQLKLKNASGKVKFSSTDKNVVKVSAKGKVTAVSAGKATVKVKNNGKTYKCKFTVKNKSGFDYSLAEKSDEEVVELLLKISNGFYAGITTEKWIKTVGKDSISDDALRLYYYYDKGHNMGQWPLEDNVAEISLYDFIVKDGKIQPDENKESRVCIEIVIADEKRATNIYNLICEKLSAEVPDGKLKDLSDVSGGRSLQTDCWSNNWRYWVVHRSDRDTGSFRYVNRDGGYTVRVLIYEDYFTR